MIGRELGGRYEILERVGGGGMAIVYKAHDILLHRNVAVKILRDQYVHDEDFIRRFRREAQSAASLSHNNVVSIYDVGQQDDTQYIVMEYVEGMTLNDLIKERAPLQVEEAVHIASQICDALDHAHINQIIHRDIKPHNILLGKNGKVKVTDFGIARAASSSTITQTGSVVGSVHYFSPEHAKGTLTGAKSDLYSLGIVMYQMLTARLPFLGESPISVALKHLQENVEEPRKVNPLIPQSVENIILKAMRKSPEERYQSAKEMLADLETCLLPERRNELKLAADIDLHDGERTRIISAIRPDQLSLDTDHETLHGNKQKTKKNWIKPVIWGLFLLLVIAAMWAGVGYLKGKMVVKDVIVPNVENKNVKVAQDILTTNGLKSDVIPEFNSSIEKDVVIRQNSTAPTVKEGSTVKLFVSKGIEKRTLPDYTGKKWKDVKLELLARGISESQISPPEEKFIDEEKDTIVSQSPKPDEEYDPVKVQVKFTISKGREKFAMPDLTGLTISEVQSRLTLKNLALAPGEAGIIYQPSFQQTKGKVFDQWPYKKGQDVEEGQKNIIIYVSTGIPEDAGEMVVSLAPFKPAVEGKPSTFRIVLSDARYDNNDYRTIQVSKTEIINVPVTVTKDKNAIIQIFRDNVSYDNQTVTYEQYLLQKNKPKSTPAASATLAPSGATSGLTSNPTAAPGTTANSPSPVPAAGGSTPKPTSGTGGR